MTVMFRILTTGAPRNGAVSILRQLDAANLGWDIDLHMSGEGPMNVITQNTLFAEARGRGVDYLICGLDDLFLEDATQLARLPGHNVPVVDCLIPFARKGHLYWHFYQLTRDGYWFSDSPYGKHGLQQVYSTSLGMACYRGDVLANEALWPLWEDNVNSDGTRKMFGCDDTYLCQKLHAHDIPMYVDCDIVCDHRKPMMIGQTMEIIRQWAQNCAQFGNSDVVYGLPSRMLGDTVSLGIDLPVCRSYRQVQDVLRRPPGLPPMRMPELCDMRH